MTVQVSLVVDGEMRLLRRCAPRNDSTNKYGCGGQ